MDYQKYTDASAPIDVPIRYASCPFCKTAKNSFVVIPRRKGFFLWCHRCHTRKWIPRGKRSPSQVKELLIKEKERVTVVELPKDFSTSIPVEQKLWFYKYGLSDSDIVKLKAGYSERLGRIIIPYYKDDVLLYWTGRFTGDYEKNKTPKYISRTKTNAVYGVYGDNADTAVIVEDVLSAYKIQKAGYTGVCIFGSYVSDKLLKELSEQFKQTYLWLDPDKRGYSSKVKNRADTLGINLKVFIKPSKDPKEYSIEEIRQRLE